MSDKNSYQLLKAGDLVKYEQLGEVVIERPAQGALWPCEPMADKRLDHRFQRFSDNKGKWTSLKDEEFLQQNLSYGPLKFVIKPTSFGHLGLFAEQLNNWRRIQEMLSGGQDYKVLNLFAYTGGSTLAAASAGAQVTHVDAAKATVEWAKENAVLNDINKEQIKWIVDDVMAFVKREARRGNKYNGIVLDPPTFGRGTKKQVWKIEKDLVPLLEELKGLMADDFLFVVLSAHSQGYSPLALSYILTQVYGSGDIAAEEMKIAATEGPDLPSGATCTWRPN